MKARRGRFALITREVRQHVRRAALLYSLAGRHANQVAERRHKRFLLRSLAAASVWAAEHADQGRHSILESRRQILGGSLCLGIARVMSWHCRMWIRDREEFARKLAFVTQQVLKEVLSGRGEGSEVPLVVLGVLWSDAMCAVVHTTCANFGCLYLASGNGVWFVVTSYWAKVRTHFRWYRILREFADPFRGEDRVVWLGNTHSEVSCALLEKQRSVLVNHNCFINQSNFPLLESAARRRFDAVMNANAGKFKRHYLARDVERLAYVTYSTDDSGKPIWPEETFSPAYINDRYLGPSDLEEVYRNSCCGLVLSACEGASYATGEFLLSGLPVVSTHSVGGREIWLTPVNSLICDATRESVGAAVGEWRRRTDACEVDRAAIREAFVAQAAQHTEAFITALQKILDACGAGASAARIFAAHRDADTLLHSLSFRKSSAGGMHPFCGGDGWYEILNLPVELLRGGGATGTSSRSQATR